MKYVNTVKHLKCKHALVATLCKGIGMLLM